MAYRFQFRGDIESNWTNVILADREIGILQTKVGNEIKNTNLYKIGDGKTAWKDLPYFGFNGALSTSLDVVDGEQTDNTVVTKGALVEKFNTLDELISSIQEGKASAEDLTNLSTRVNSLEEWKAKIDGKDYDAKIATLEDSSKQYATDIQTLKDMHVVKAQDEFDPSMADPNIFYYIYEETKE